MEENKEKSKNWFSRVGSFIGGKVKENPKKAIGVGLAIAGLFGSDSAAVASVVKLIAEAIGN